MIKQILLIVSLFGLFTNKPTRSEPLNFRDDFEDNSNGWVQEEINNSVLIQRIENGMLYLESNSDELGVASSIDFEFDESRDFEIETRVKILTDNYHCNVTLDFGIKQNVSGSRSAGGQDVNTTWGASSYYFGYSNSQEYLMAKWNKGKEKYYSRGYAAQINPEDFNIIIIKKEGKTSRFFINNQLVFEKPYKKMFGTGIGFSSSPNSRLWVDYFKITN